MQIVYQRGVSPSEPLRTPPNPSTDTRLKNTKHVFARAGLKPSAYWGSEIVYCILSLTAKLYLGLFLLFNVIMIDGKVEDNLKVADGALTIPPVPPIS